MNAPLGQFVLNLLEPDNVSGYPREEQYDPNQPNAPLIQSEVL